MEYSATLTCFLFMYAISAVAALQVEIQINKNPVRIGETAIVVCGIVGFPPAHFIYWKKTVKVFGQDQDEVIATSTVVNPPYDQRYRSTVADVGEVKEFSLTITEIQKEDHGKISCVIPKTSDIITETRRHVEIDVMSQIDSIEFENYTTGQSIEFTEGVPRKLGCWVRGTTMLPIARVNLGKQDRTNTFKQDMIDTPFCTGNQASKNCPIHTIRSMHLTNDGFIATHEDHGKRLNCSAKIIDSDLPTVSAYLDVQVKFKPKFLCKAEQGAALHAKNVNVTCWIKARPPLESVYWVVAHEQSQPIRIKPGDTTDDGYKGYQTEKVPDRPQTKLILGISTVYKRHYIPYKLVVENAEGRSDFTVNFIERTIPISAATIVHTSFTLLPVWLLALLR